MATQALHIKWCDGLFLSTLAPTGMVVWSNWRGYCLCNQPLHTWIVVNCATLFVSWLLTYLDKAIAAGMSLERGLNTRQRLTCFCGRVVILLILSLLLYPFLWVWTVIGTVWFTSARSCLPEGQKLGFFLWLFFSYCILLSIGWNYVGKVLVDVRRVPGWWTSETAAHEVRIVQEISDRPGFYLSTTQRKAVEALIQKLPKFRLEAVSTDCNECPICLEDFRVNNEVRGLPCSHNFHVECIDKWLQLNVRCPQCRGLVFPNFDFSAHSDHRTSPGLQTASVVTTNLFVPVFPSRPSLHGLPNPVFRENPVADSDTETALETAENGGLTADQGPPCASV